MYIPSAEMGEYDSVKPPPQKRMSSKQLLEAKYGNGSLDRQSSKGNMTGKKQIYLFSELKFCDFDRLLANPLFSEFPRL